MFKQIILPLLGVIVFIIIVGLFVQKSSSLNLSNLGKPQPTATTEKVITVGSKKVSIQIARSSEEKAKGLSGTESLGADSGMLFVFSPKTTPLFWMKDMLIPLDMIWISDGKIVRIDKNIPFPELNTPDSALKTYSPGQPIDYILEVNAEYSDKNNIKTGDSVDLSGI